MHSRPSTQNLGDPFLNWCRCKIFDRDGHNALMMRWISYIVLLNYVMHHIPSQSHVAEDGLSRRRRVSEDSDDEDAKEYLNQFMASAHSTPSSLSLFQFANSLSLESLYRFRPLPLDQNFLSDLLSTMRRMPKTPYALFSTSTHASVVSFLSTSEPSHTLGEEIWKIKGIPYDAWVRDSSKGSLMKYSLLSITDNFSYTWREFKFRKVCNSKVIDCILGGEAHTFEIFSYERAYMSSLKQSASPQSITNNSTFLSLLASGNHFYDKSTALPHKPLCIMPHPSMKGFIRSQAIFHSLRCLRFSFHFSTQPFH